MFSNCAGIFVSLNPDRTSRCTGRALSKLRRPEVLVHVTVVSLQVQPRGQLYEVEEVDEVELDAELSRTSSTAASRDGRIVEGCERGG